MSVCGKNVILGTAIGIGRHECRRVRRSATDTAGFAAEDLRERGYVVEPLNLIVMDYSVLLQKYAPVASDSLVESVVAKARAEMDRNRNEEVYRFCFSALDLTTLSGSDSVRSVAEFVKKAVDVPVRFPGMPNVATVCVYPSFVDIAGLGVEGTNIGVTSVAGGFPAAQTYLEVKMLEVAMAVENGARRNRCGDECGRNGGGRVRPAGQRPRTALSGKPDRK